MRHNFTFSKTVCDYIMYLYTLREATRWEGNIFKGKDCEIASKVYDCVTTGNYEPEQSEVDTNNLPSEVAVLSFVNPKFIEAHHNDMKLGPFTIDGKLEKSAVEIFLGWLKKIRVESPKDDVFYPAESFYSDVVENCRYVYNQPTLVLYDDVEAVRMAACSPFVGLLMTTVQSHIVHTLKDNPIMQYAYSAMLDIIAVTEPTDYPEFKTHQPPNGLLFTAMLIDEYNRELHTPVVGNRGLRDMIDDIFCIAAEARSDVHKYTNDEINVAGCIRWFLFSGVDITKQGVVETVPDAAYDSASAGHLAYLLGYNKILECVIYATVACDVEVTPDTGPVMFLSWRKESSESLRGEGLMTLMKLKQRMDTPEYVRYCLCLKEKKLVIG